MDVVLCRQIDLRRMKCMCVKIPEIPGVGKSVRVQIPSLTLSPPQQEHQPWCENWHNIKQWQCLRGILKHREMSYPNIYSHKNITFCLNTFLDEPGFNLWQDVAVNCVLLLFLKPPTVVLDLLVYPADYVSGRYFQQPWLEKGVVINQPAFCLQQWLNQEDVTPTGLVWMIENWLDNSRKRSDLSQSFIYWSDCCCLLLF